MENIRIGLNVDIKRSDGRIHSAVISSVNQENQSVTVEWFERGETKGKEMDLDTILQLNPQYSEGPDEDNTSSMKVSDSKKGLRRTLQQSKLINSQTDTGSKQEFKKSRTNGGRPTMSHLPAGSHQLSTHTSALPAPSPHLPNSSIPAPSVPPGPGLVNGTHHNHGDDGNPSREKQSAMTSSTLAAKKEDRRSNTVKEIEKLKENREKRRAQQEEQRARKQDLMEQDPGNPNWEFMAMIREFQETLDYHPLKMTDTVKDQRITVVVRKRPLNKKENGRKEVDVVIVPNRAHCIIHEPKTKVDLTKYLENQDFRFDYAMDETVTNEMVYRFTAQPLVKTIFEEGFATCFAYGQTGSGKTHTMGGDFNGKSQDCTKGVYAFTARDVFRLLHKKYSKENLVVSCSFFEIYSGKLFDLLNSKAKLRVLEDGKNQVQVVGLREVPVENESDVLKLIQEGNDVRTSGQTSANNNSSRSHAVFQIILRKRGIRSKLHGKFSLIDLAGNERGKDTSSTNRQTRMEGAEINKSLLALKECIRALGRKNAHLPFRASKLTLVLRDSFVGDNSRTCMIAMISPGMSSCENTLNTLRYADRVKELNPGAAEEEDYPMSETPGMESVADSDLVFLHSQNEAEYSEDLYDYQMDIDKLQILEDQLIEDHGDVYDARFKWEKQDAELLKMTDVVDYDCETYAQKLDTLVDHKLHKLTKLKESVTNYRKQLAEEERQASKMKSSRKH